MVEMSGETRAAPVSSETTTTPQPSPPPETRRAAPLWVFPVLALSVVAMSSGGLWFALLRETPPALKAAWRLIATAALQLGPFLYEAAAAPAAKVPGFAARWRAHVPVMVLAGVFLAVHFVAWSWSISHTSLTHSLLLVWTTPLIMVAAMALRHAASRALSPPAALAEVAGAGGPSDAPAPERTLGALMRHALAPERSLPPTALEAAGSTLSFAAAAILILSASSSGLHEPGVTVEGDLMAFVGAAAVWLYLEVGGSLRSWMPLFHYVFPVTLESAISAALMSLLFESGVSLRGSSPSSLLGFFFDTTSFGLVLGAAICSGSACTMNVISSPMSLTFSPSINPYLV